MVEKVLVDGVERTSREVQIEIYPSQLYCTTRAFILRKFGVLNPSAYLNRKGELVSDEHDGGGGHSWVEESVILKDPPADLVKALNAIESLQSLLSDYKS